MKRMNEEWEIIGAVKVGEESGRNFEVVLGYRETRFGKEWVTWECNDDKGKYNYYWGHYYDNQEHALEDFGKRIIDAYKYFRKYEVEEA